MKKSMRGIAIYIVLLLMIIFIVKFSGGQHQKTEEIDFSKFYTQLQSDNIKDIHIIDQTGIRGTLKDGNIKFKTYIPREVMGSKLSDDILAKIEKNKLSVGAEPKPKTPWILEMMPTFILLVFMIIMFVILMGQAQGGGGKMMNFSKSKARVHKPDEADRVTFDDVAGLKEEKSELEEVVDFLKNPFAYIKLGARIPKGILLVGPPGTGKTYLSRAVAGEAGVPFFSISGSDFVEMFVGVGASRVRDLFEEAKKASPAIIFIDEIDAVGRKRGAGLGGGHDEREQTLNQLLVEMDGFGVNQGIIIMAATNRPDILDPALLRPGRFDRQVVVGNPDVKGREAIFGVHSKNKPLADDVDLKVLAKTTPGFSPADIENIMNEAAILTARKKEEKISMKNIEESITKVVVGIAKKSRIMSDKEKILTAYHEGGHAVCAHVLDLMDPVHQVTIIPRGMTGGFTMQLPMEDKYYSTKGEMMQELIVLLAGRVSEELNLDDISTGASNDLERATSITRAMVSKYGMSDSIGPVVYQSNDEVFIGNSIGHSKDYSEGIAQEIDKEVRRILTEAYDKTREVLKTHKPQLDYIAKALLEYETLDQKQFEQAFNMTLPLHDENDEENKHEEHGEHGEKQNEEPSEHSEKQNEEHGEHSEKQNEEPSEHGEKQNVEHSEHSEK